MGLPLSLNGHLSSETFLISREQEQKRIEVMNQIGNAGKQANVHKKSNLKCALTLKGVYTRVVT